MLPALEKQGIRFLKRSAWTEAQAPGSAIISSAR
jgi:hypothetical protein